MALKKFPVVGTGRVRKNTECTECGGAVERYRSFRQVRTPWNKDEDGTKDRRRILDECREEAAAWRSDPERCSTCWASPELPVLYDMRLWRNRSRTGAPILSLMFELLHDDLERKVVEVGAESAAAGLVEADDWGLCVELWNAEIAHVMLWLLCPASRGVFTARRIP